LAEVWLHLLLPSHLDWKRVRQTGHLDMEEGGPALANLWMLGGGREFLTATFMGPYRGLGVGDLELSLRTWSSLMTGAIGEKDHRFTYGQWTELLHSWIAYTIMSSSHILDVLEELISLDCLDVNIGETNVTVSMTLRLRRILTRLIPRLTPPSP
jgi:hypothetical protein